jgi:cytochrome b
MNTTDESTTIQVWDPLVRTMYWVLVIAFFTAYFTEDDLLTAHAWAGYVVGGIVVLRLIWGFIGTRHARFTDFIYPPTTIIRNLLDLFVPGGGRRYLGHTPAGGVMIIALLIGLAITVWSGLEVYALDKGKGPVAGSVPSSAELVLDKVVTPALAAEEEREHVSGTDKQAEEYWEEFHEVAANITLALVILHILGVIAASLAHRENLVRAMVTGRKRSDE